MFRRKQACHTLKVRYSLLPVMSCWCHISMFVNYRFCHWRQTLVKCENTPIGHCADWPQKYANLLCNFPLWTVFMVYFLGSVRDSELCQCWQAYVHCITVWMTTCPLSVERLNTVGPVHFFLFKHFISLIFNCLCIVRKHLAQTFHSITLADSQTFYQRFVFNGKTHNLQTQKYDVNMTSPVAKNI